ncbi:GGDEF domain-containing protein [Enterobacter hormaechei]|uniref:GGDEF domain-containing protein n=1 Tax=Enterobacter hormaechei TaxID=158836 RepID=UPI0032DBEA60
MLITAISIYRMIIRMNSSFSIVHARSLHDELTRLPNRRYFVEAMRNSNSQQLSIMMIDIDFFKQINDRWGHAAGDEVLCRFGFQLADINGPTTKVFRIGGEEFAVITEDITQDEMLSVAESIRIKSRQIKMDDGQSISVSIGIGFREEGESLQSLMKKNRYGVVPS